jgi:hypothetical protein
MNSPREEFRSVGEEAQTDKILHHGYERFYPDFLSPFCHGQAILEVGYGSGQSVAFWRDLFPNSPLYLLDIGFAAEGEGYRVIQCDQSSVEQLNAVATQLRDLNVGLVVDDGSHIPEHQLATFNVFFSRLLVDGGVYVIEDIETSYWRRGRCYGYPTDYGIRSPRSFVRLFSLLIHWVNREFLSPGEKVALGSELVGLGFDPVAMSRVASVCFGQNCIRVLKDMPGDERYSDRHYRFMGNVMES